MKAAVIGLGKLGLPVAAYYANGGASVVGVDIAPQVVETVNAGESPVGPEPGMDEAFDRLVESGALRATTDFSDVAGADVVIVLVPLLAHDGEPDFSALDAATAALAPHLSSGALVIYETTLPVGATRGRFTSVLRDAQASCLVAFSPERVSSGRIWRDLETYPKLVGGVDQASADAAAAFYGKYLPAEIRTLHSAEEAELVKLAETTYRDLNIAFANELARFSDEWGVDVVDVIEAANSQPYSHIHRPGVGVGGHCIPHYPYLLQGSTSGSDLVAAGRTINERMPAWVADRIEREAGPITGHTVVIRGVAYRGGVKESASSPTFALAEALEDRGATVLVEDPCYSEDEVRALGFQPWAGESAAVVVVATDHAEYHSLDWSAHPPALVVDGRNRLDRAPILEAGHTYLGIGRS